LVRQLVEAGIHFGHRASRWNPKMAPYIFGKRNTIHIIDIRETIKGLLRARKFIAQVVAGGGDILFVGTKRQARQHIRHHATRVGMPYVVERWLGGTLTNFRTIRSRLARLEELEAAETDGTALEYSKKMIASRTRELRKIKRNLEGIRGMNKLPGVVVVIDVRREHNAVREAKKLGIPTICLIDTDSDPDFADLPIPGNDDAMRSIEAVLTHLADAVEEGLKGRAAAAAAAAEEAEESREPRRRSARPAAGRAADTPAPAGQPTAEAAGGGLPASEETESASGADGPDEGLAPATATEPEVTQ
jgi:small subunit ribosomal protein S2